MFIEDGSNIDYSKESISNRYSWGWLGDRVPHDRLGWSDQKLKSRVVARLREIMDATYEYECFGKKRKGEKYCVLHHCGSHACEICGKPGEWPPPKEADYEIGWNGSILIDYNNKEFRCPWAVVHYIRRHDYHPPDEAIDALFHGHIRTYDEVDGESLRQHHRRMEEEAAKKREKLAEIERNKTPEEKRRDQELKEWRDQCAEKVKQLRESGAIIG